MRFTTVLSTLFTVSAVVAASFPGRGEEHAPVGTRRMSSRRHAHAAHARSASGSQVQAKRMTKKRKSCSVTSSNSTVTDSTPSSTTAAAIATMSNAHSGKHSHTRSATSTADDSGSTSTDTPSSSTKSSTRTRTATGSAASATPSSSTNGTTDGVVYITDPTCGGNDPTKDLAVGLGPNGKQDWFNCGLNDGGWTPPMIKLEQLVFVPLADALKMENNQFAPCTDLLSIFQEVSASCGVPDIMLASIAMQESTCQPKAYSAGSTGLFQLSSDLCSPYSDCYDPKSNTEGGCNYIKTLLGQFDDNIAEVLGNYNGWYKGIKPADVQDQPCATRQNWNYLQNIFNGFMQGIDGNNNGNVNDGCQGSTAT